MLEATILDRYDKLNDAISTSTNDICMLLQVLCRNSGSTLGYGFATLMEEDDDSSSEEEDEPLRPMSLSGATP